ncbi:hypothetical protein AAVH_05500 [Aphelenchoides avenae]|nr:hypothetical protein AAVH_05500 [Aphelenchus avenae]
MLRRLRRKERQQRKHDIPACPSIEELAIYDNSLEYTPSFGSDDTKPASDETSCISEADFAKIREALKSVGQSVNDGNPFADDGLKERCESLRQKAKNRVQHLSGPTLAKNAQANGLGYAGSSRRNVAVARQSFSDTDYQMRMLDRGLPYCTSSSSIKYHSEYNLNGSYASLCFCKVMAVLSKIVFESGAILMHVSTTYPAVVGFLALAILLYSLILYLEFSVAIVVETTMQCVC